MLDDNVVKSFVRSCDFLFKLIRPNQKMYEQWKASNFVQPDMIEIGNLFSQLKIGI